MLPNSKRQVCLYAVDNRGLLLFVDKKENKLSGKPQRTTSLPSSDRTQSGVEQLKWKQKCVKYGEKKYSD